MPKNHLPNVPSSLEVPRERINVVNETMRTGLMELARRLGNQEQGRDGVRGAMRRIIRTLPPEFHQEIKNMQGFENELCDVVLKYHQQGKLNNPRPEDIEMAVSELIAIFIRHQTTQLVAMKSMDPKVLAAHYDPIIREKYKSITAQKLMRVVVWVGAGVTSFLGLTHYMGKFLNYIQGVTTLKVGAETAMGVRYLLSAAGAVGTSQLVNNFKEEVENVGHKEDAGAVKSAKTVAKSVLRRRGKIPLMLAALPLIFDIATNWEGIASWQLGGLQKRDQLAEATKKIDERVGKVRGQIGEIQKIPDMIAAQARHAIEDEDKGASETGKGGKGPMYDVKSFEYEEDPAAIAKLDGSKDAFRQRLHDAVMEAKVVDGKPIDQEFKAKIAEHVAAVEQLLTDVQTQGKNLDESKEIENLQKDIDKIVHSVEEAIGILKADLPEDLGKKIDVYNALNKRLAEIAEATGRYPNINKGKLTMWKVPELDVDNSRIELPKMHFIGFEDLIRVARQKWNPAETALFLSLFLMLAVAASYVDLITMIRTRKAYTKDRAKAAKVHDEWISQFENKIAGIITRVLNDGPFSRYLNPGVKVHPRAVVEALNERIGELAHLKRDQYSFKAMQMFLPIAAMDDYRGFTEVAQHHNARVNALTQIMGSGNELQGLLMRVLPGLRIIESPSAGDTSEGAKRLNDDHLTKEKKKFEAVEIAELTTQFNQIRMGGGMLTSMAQCEDVKAQCATSLNESNLEHDNIDPDNQEGYEELMQLYGNTMQVLNLRIVEVTKASFDQITESTSELKDVNSCKAAATACQDTMVKVQPIHAQLEPENIAAFDDMVEAHQRALHAVNVRLTYVIQDECRMVQIDPSANEIRLTPIIQTMERFRKYLGEIDSMGHHDVEEGLENATAAINEVMEQINEVRSQRRGEIRAGARLENIAKQTRDADFLMRKLGGWLSTNEALAAEDRAEALCELLGERYAIRGLAVDEKLPDDVAKRLEQQYDKFDRALRFLYNQPGYNNKKEEISSLLSQLDQDMAQIRLFYP